ncbi:SLATT domain-containing protein [Paenibacillus taichungensis]|uniref:SLATT domain-containing protein n=1 Tax=Paenibacillus taichungensis TaxID=484184 RepID=UPI002DBD3858|nr:SLATT domain-containing protein [Paenibacillus taichungensis]MEC0106780.1 SLATT domain-containing protein [Paenibacillus taichungensis]MEC0195290.1 SLATT domain-containing protein [Paenibacillus taichungensis]
MKEILEEIKSFTDNRIWVTKKTRMESETRLKRNHIVSNIIINYYTFAVLAFSIWSLVLDPESYVSKYVTLMTVISSVGLFGVTLLISSLGYRERALQFKESYLKLDSLESEFKHLSRSAYQLSKEDVIERFHMLEKKYFDILSLSDNHDSIDTKKLSINRKKEGYELDLISYKKSQRLGYALIIGLFLIPLVLVGVLIYIS